MQQIPIKPVTSKFNDEQWQAIHMTGNNILVSASAGSGKTTVLIERILTHLKEKFANIDELLVVTFTEAAAAEMKNRMNVRLQEMVNQFVDDEARKLYLEQMRKLPQAHIQTLHSFCLQVIQQYFYLIDFNPNFSLMTDETQKTILFEEVWAELVNKIMSGELQDEPNLVTPSEYLNLLGRFSLSRTDEGLFNVVKELHQFATSHTEPEHWLKDMSQSSKSFSNFSESKLYDITIKVQIQNISLAGFKLLDSAHQQLLTLSNETIEKYEGILQSDRAHFENILNAANNETFESLLKHINNVSFDRWPSNKKNSDDYEVVVEIKDIRDRAKKYMTDQVSALFPYPYEQTLEIEAEISQISESLSHLTLLFSQALKDRKAEMNVIDYNDLEHLTLDILAPYNEEISKRQASIAANYYQNLFNEVLVDEYQDINEIQAAILSWLSHESRDDLVNNLFMVGDVKQSIYGFRMAEPSLFLNKYRAYQEKQNGELIILNQNYRSRDEILQFSNFVFERLMSEDFGEMAYGEADSLKTANTSFITPAPSPNFNVDFLLYEKIDETDEAAEVEEEEIEANQLIDSSIEAEAHLIAQNIQKQMANEFIIYDKDKNVQKERKVKYSDFVILTSTRYPFLIVQQIFEMYGIPLYAQKVENFFQRQEVLLMVSLLKIIDNPIQDIPLVAILRSYFVGLSDDQLAQIRIESKNGSYYQAVIHYIHSMEHSDNMTTEQTDIYHKLLTFYEQLTHWTNLSHKVSLVELIWTIYQETNFLDYVVGLTNGEQRQANLHAFYERAAHFEQSSYKGVYGFVDYIEKVIQRENDLAEPVLLDDDQNFVRIMTVHASKGLEFPIVYLMNTAKQFNLTDVNHKRYIASKHYGIGMDLYDYQTMTRYHSVIKDALKIERINQTKAEEMRKLYVALTRVEQKLIIVGSVKSQDTINVLQDEAATYTPINQLVINTQDRQKAKSWLEWLLQAIAIDNHHSLSISSFKRDQINIEYFTQDEILSDLVQVNDTEDYFNQEAWLNHLIEKIKIKPQNLFPFIQQINHLMTTEYSHQLATLTSSYQSVSELKRLYEEPRIEKLNYFTDRSGLKTNPFDSLTEEDTNITYDLEIDRQEGIQGIRYTGDTFLQPSFMQDKTVDYAEIGTITHFILQQLEFNDFKESKDYAQTLNQQLNDLLTNQMIDSEQLSYLQIDKIVWLLESELGQYFIHSKQTLNRERAFSLLIPAQTIFKHQREKEDLSQLTDDQLLVHGVIDNYVLLDDGSWMIVDYKTDRFKAHLGVSRDEQIKLIINKYIFQLSLYQKALMSATQTPVSRVGLVLLDFESIEWLNENQLISFD